jgi:hypothetical protein
VYYQVTALNQIGESLPSTEVSISVNLIRDNWTTGDYVTLAWNAVAGAERYQIYYSDETGYEVFLDSTTATAYEDNGTIATNPWIEVPTDDTTSGPKFKQMELSDNRLWGTGDPSNLWRIYWTGQSGGTIEFYGWYGGGWADIELGGQEMPVSVVHYRTGNGDSAATILCQNAEGTGTIWQVTLLVDATSGITTPNIVKVVGSIGTTSPLGVVSAGNSIFFPNKGGVYTLGNAPQLLNILETDERSQMIRPDYRGMNQNLIGNICGIWYDSKVFYSGAVGTENDTVFIADLERGCWNWYWDFGVKTFLEATDASGQSHLLYVPPQGNQLVEISKNFDTDFGEAITTSYISPLMSFSKDDTQFAKVIDVVLTIGKLQGAINVEILGVGTNSGFSTVGVKSINASSSSGIMFVDGVFGQYRFSYRTESPKVYALPSTKGWVRVQKKLNSIQVHIYSTQAGTQYSLLDYVIRGRMIPTAVPSAWKK